MRRAVVASMATLILAACSMFEAPPTASDPCGLEQARDENLASEALHACAALGDADAQAYLAMIYWGDSDSVYPDPEQHGGLSADQLRAEGRRLMESAARKGNREAQNELGLAHLKGLYGVPVDFERAFSLLTASDQQGDPVATYNLAVIYYAGYGRPRSVDEAERLLWRSAASGYQPALCTLALLREQSQALGMAEVFRVAARGLDAYGFGCAFDHSDVVEEFR